MKFDLLDQEQGGQRDWVTVLGEPKTVSEAADYLQQQIVSSQMQYVPHKDVTHRGIQCPWLNKPIRRLIERKNAQFRTLKRSGENPASLAKYKKACKKLKVPA
ncbi:MAG: hypothetical protein GY696_27990 [Gammaproteobacteria bacterium]|nr:hypothetical protein [Gammaproteobacteria bacterium]